MLACAYNLRKCGVSTCANVVHMATKYEWTAFDYASQQAAAKIIADSGYSYRTISEMMNNAVSHVRISDIEKGRKAPIKLSEFLLLYLVVFRFGLTECLEIEKRWYFNAFVIL